jgi:glycosyltransferase involved in cell wall biosynthesis
MKKVIIVTNIPAVYRIDLFSQLGKRGFKIFFYDFNSKILDHCYYKGSLEFPWAKVKFWNLFFKLVKENPHMVFCINASHITFICGLYTFLFKKKFFIWWAGTYLSERKISFLKKIFRKVVFNLADKFIAYSEFAAQYLESFNVPKSKIEILGNVTFDPLKFYHRVSEFRKVQKKGSHVTILSVGNFLKRKNYDFLLDIYSELKNKYTNIKLLIVGDGPEKKKLVERVKRDNIKDVEFVGKIRNENIYKFYGVSDIFVHTALMDQWPQVVNEALASKLPVVVSKFSGVSEILFENGKDLYICDLNKEIWVSVIEKLIAESRVREEMANNGFNKLENIWERGIKVFLNLIEEV